MTQPQTQPVRITHQFLQIVRISNETLIDRFLLPVMLAIGILYSAIQLLGGDAVMGLVSGAGVILLLTLTAVKPVQRFVLRRRFDRSHAFYVGVFWVYSLLWVWAFREVARMPSSGKESEPFYIFVILFVAITFRVLLTLFALTPRGNDLMVSKLPLWEQILIAVNEFFAAGLLAFVAGSEMARVLQTNLLTVYRDPVYMGMLLAVLMIYYLMIQLMWLQRWNDWLSRNNVWVRLARLLAPLALVVATMVIIRHYTRLSDTRTADLLGTANIDQKVLALSPVIWIMIFFVFLVVYTGGRGLRQRFLPYRLLAQLPERVKKFLSTVSDMDILLLCGVLSSSIPLHALLFDDASVGLLDTLRQQIELQNSLIDSAEQALSVVFALPFYLLALFLLIMYAWVLRKPNLPAEERDALVDRLPIGFLIIVIITLYLCAIPFSQVLSEGRLPKLPEELGRVLAFDVLIPLVLLYGHYFLLVRIPYGRGQTRWRVQRAAQLERDLRRTDGQIDEVQTRIQRTETLWGMRRNLRANQDEKIDLLYEFIDMNSERDHLNMERLRILSERQQLAEISESPLSLAITRLPTQVISVGIPLLLAFKIYEWAVVNDGLREIANNPNISVIEFFQIILRQAQF